MDQYLGAFTDADVDDIVGAALVSGFTVDVLVALMAGLDARARATLLGNVSSLPVYMKSSEIPYFSRSLIAPSIEMRISPDSHCEYDFAETSAISEKSLLDRPK